MVNVLPKVKKEFDGINLIFEKHYKYNLLNKQTKKNLLSLTLTMIRQT